MPRNMHKELEYLAEQAHRARVLTFQRRSAALTGIIQRYVELEDGLPSRHQGPKGRAGMAVQAIRNVAPEVPEDLARQWLNWAVQTWEMRLMDLDPATIAKSLAETIADRWFD